MFKTRCGCPYCKGEFVPVARFGSHGWKSRRNKHGHLYGSHPKPRKAHKQAH